MTSEELKKDSKRKDLEECWFLKNGWEFFIEERRNMCSNQRTQHGERPRLEKSMVLPKKQDSSPRSDGDTER